VDALVEFCRITLPAIIGSMTTPEDLLYAICNKYTFPSDAIEFSAALIAVENLPVSGSVDIILDSALGKLRKMQKASMLSVVEKYASVYRQME
jgi:hypothetical protein